MKRALAFFLGMIFGMIVLVGGVALAGYIALVTVKPKDIVPETTDYIGDLANMSLWNIGKSVSNLYISKAGMADADGHYYSLGEFCEYYNIDTAKAFGVELPADVMDFPAFELFAGSDGFNRVTNQVKVSAILSLANIVSSDELVRQKTLDELGKYNISELLDENKGIPHVFENVLISDILGAYFPSENTGSAVMWAIGQASIGKLYAAIGGSDSLFLLVKKNNALEKLGEIYIADLLGGHTGVLGSVLGKATLSDLVNDSGSINLDPVISTMYLGSVLGCTRNEIVNVSSYKLFAGRNDGSVWIDDSAAIPTYVKQCGDYYYFAELTCEEAHQHNTACFEVVWYNNTKLPPDHTCADDELKLADGHHARITGLYKGLTNLLLEDMMNGSSDEIVKQIENLKLTDIVGSVSGIMSSFGDMTIKQLLNGGIDAMYLGAFLDFTRTPANTPASYTEIADGDKVCYIATVGDATVMSDNSRAWYEAKLVCDETHSHHRSCYSYIWMDGDVPVTGMMAKLSDIKIAELHNINEKIQQLTLADVLGEENLQEGILAEMKDVAIKDISRESKQLYLGSVLEFYRKTVEIDDEFTVVPHCQSVKTNGSAVVKSDDDEIWYQAALDCVLEHDHHDKCYGFVWYTDKELQQEVSGIQKAFVNTQLGEVNHTLNNLTLRKLDIHGNNILDAMQDVPLNSIGTEINKMELGIVLGYHKNTANVWVDDAETVVLGLNAKMSDMTVAELGSGNGLTDIVQSLTIGDLIDSGMMEVAEEDQYKLDIIFCTDSESFSSVHNVQYGGLTYPVTESYQCRLSDFLQFTLHNPNETAHQFYLRFECHNSENDCHCKWREMQLSTFIAALLSAVK